MAVPYSNESMFLKVLQLLQSRSTPDGLLTLEGKDSTLHVDARLSLENMESVFTAVTGNGFVAFTAGT